MPTVLPTTARELLNQDTRANELQGLRWNATLAGQTYGVDRTQDLIGAGAGCPHNLVIAYVYTIVLHLAHGE
jgi:hypothetical protein